MVRCLEPPRSTSINPLSALAIASHKDVSSIPCCRAKRTNHLFLKILNFLAFPALDPIVII